jgi:hypothetical protein
VIPVNKLRLIWCTVFLLALSTSFHIEVNPAFAAGLQTASLEVVFKIKLDKQPLCIAVNEVSNKVYVGVEGGIVVIDSKTKQILTEVPINTTSGNYDAQPEWIIVDSLNNKIFISSSFDEVSVFNETTFSKLGRISEHPNRDQVTIDSKRNLIYVAGISGYIGESDYISVYDENSLNYLTSIIIPGSFETETQNFLRIAVDIDLNRIYAEWSFNHTLFSINGSTHEVLKAKNLNSLFTTTWLRPDQIGIAVFNSPTNKIYLAGGKILDTDTFEQTSWLNLDYVTCFDCNNSIAYGYPFYSTETNHTFQIVGTFSNDVLGSLTLDGMDGMLYSSVTNTKTGEIYFADSNSNQIIVVQLHTTSPALTPTPTSTIPEFPASLAAAILLCITATMLVFSKKRASRRH